MGHNISWDNDDKTVVLQQYTEGASKDDLYHLAQKSAQMLNSVEHTVHLIIDERNVNHLLNPADMAYLEKLIPKNQGSVVVILSARKAGYKATVQKLARRVAPTAFAEAYFVESLEEARKFLRESFDVRYPSETSQEKP